MVNGGPPALLVMIVTTGVFSVVDDGEGVSVEGVYTAFGVEGLARGGVAEVVIIVGRLLCAWISSSL